MTQNSYRSAAPEKEPVKFNFKGFSDRRLQIALGLSLLLISILLFVSFISYLQTGKADQSVVESFLQTHIKISGKEVANWFGVVGAISAHFFIFKWFGFASLLIPPFLFNLGVVILYRKRLFPITRSFVFSLFYLIWTSLLTGYLVYSASEVSEWGYVCGGIGYELAIIMDGLLGWGSMLFVLFLFIIFNMYFFNITSLPQFDEYRDRIDRFKNFFKFKKNLNEETDDSNDDPIQSVIARVKQEVELEELGLNTKEEQEEDETLANWTIKEVKPEKNQEVKPATNKKEPFDFSIEDNRVKPAPVTKNIELDLEKTITLPPVTNKPIFEEEDELEMEIEESEFDEVFTDQMENYDPTLDLPHYKYPTADLLIDYPVKDVRVSKEELEANKDKIVETLINFKIGISSIKATIGPTVTLYEIVPEAGVKISKIKNLEDDIALSLAALGIRIIAPIPGKGTIGIEVPNKNREMVDAKSVITTEKFMKSDKELPIVLGKTISNEVFVTDLAKMPHLLMAGATGQGKSVGLNIILASLIYKKHPSQLKLVLVDPKKVELTLFNKLERHFLAMIPNSGEAIITDTSKVVYTLNSLCIEMDTRYDLLKDAGCRNLKEYNYKFIKRRLNPNKGHRYLPYIVLVIDELADLMMTAGKEVETPIARLAQLARAIGIHLIVATQRPSVNVITGIIKANFPARLSFRVTSKVDSRTILDAGGADQLVGQGDMLLSMGSEIIRLQCAFVDTPEIEQICEFVGSQRGYDTAYMLPEYEGGEESGISDVDLSERDALFDEAARLIVRHQQGSTSLIQRKMKLGYNRAGRIIDQLEAAGIVGAFEGSKAREVLIQDEYSLEQLLSNLDS